MIFASSFLFSKCSKYMATRTFSYQIPANNFQMTGCLWRLFTVSFLPTLFRWTSPLQTWKNSSNIQVIHCHRTPDQPMLYGKSLYFWMHLLLLPQGQPPICWAFSSGIQIFLLLCYVLQLFSLPPVAWKNVIAGFRAGHKCPQSPRGLSVSTTHLPPSSICNEVWEVGKLQGSHLQVEMTP